MAKKGVSSRLIVLASIFVLILSVASWYAYETFERPLPMVQNLPDITPVQSSTVDDPSDNLLTSAPLESLVEQPLSGNTGTEDELLSDESLIDTDQFSLEKVSPKQVSKLAEQYSNDIAQLENGKQQLKATQQLLLNGERSLAQLREEWQRNALQLSQYEQNKLASQAAESYQLPDEAGAEALLNRLRSSQRQEQTNHPSGMSSQVMTRIQDTTGISSTELEDLMNK